MKKRTVKCDTKTLALEKDGIITDCCEEGKNRSRSGREGYKFSFGHTSLRIPFKLPSGNPKKRIGYSSLEFRTEVWSSDLHLGIHSICMIFKKYKKYEFLMKLHKHL